MNLLPHHKEELIRFGQFISECLSDRQNTVLWLFATQDIHNEDAAKAMNYSVKTIEKYLFIITRKYQDFYGLSEQNASFRWIRIRAACYYFFKDLLEESKDPPEELQVNSLSSERHDMLRKEQVTQARHQ